MGEQRKVNSFEEFLTVLREHEIKTFTKFVCISSQKAFYEEKFTPTENMKVHWKGDVPYYFIGRKVYACHQGKDLNLYQKRRYAERRDSKARENPDSTECRRRAPLTKKLDCPVLIKVSRVLSLPRFKVSKITRFEKLKMSEIIKGKIEHGRDLDAENVYSFNLPDETSHKNHITGMTAAEVETIDPKVRSKIKELVSQGKRNVSKIAALVEQYVSNELGETNKLKSQFYPLRSLIRNIVNAEKNQIRLSVDLENTEQLVEEECNEPDEICNEPDEICDEPDEICNEPDEICNQPEESNEECKEALKWKRLHEINSKMISLQSVIWLLEEDYLEIFKYQLQNLYEDAMLHVTRNKDTTLSLAIPSSSKRKNKNMFPNAKLPKSPRKEGEGFGHADVIIVKL